MSKSLRSLSTLALVAGVAAVVSCADGPEAPSKPGVVRGRFSISAAFTPAAAAVYAQRAVFPSVTFDHVRIVLVRPPADTVRDTTIVFNQNSPPATLDLTVDVRAMGEVFTGALDYTNNGQVVFHGETRLTSHPVDEPGQTSEVIKLDYVGLGANATRLVVSPKSITLPGPASTTFTATAFDASNVAVSVPLAWSSSDPSIAAVSANTGVVTVATKPGTATITARTPTGLSDAGTVTAVLPPAGITLVSGGGQTGKVGRELAQPGVVRVVAATGAGVPGVTVMFGAPAGGTVSPASVTSDANGLASTALTLGGALGPQSFAASAGGFSVSINATATAGDPAKVTVISGSGQQDVAGRALKQPLVVKVADAFGNGLSGLTVNWARTSGGGTLAAAASTTNADGLASMSYKLGGSVGVETVSATVAGIASGATFTVSVLASEPVAITIVSGNGQSAAIAQTLAPFVVRVTDGNAKPVAGVTVTWVATNGTIAAQTTTDVQGQSSNTMTAGSVAAAASATATIGSGATAKSAIFIATVQAGRVARLAFTTQPSTAQLYTRITPPVQVESRDASGNLTTTAHTVTIALGANPGSGTLLGTLTQTSVGGIATFDDLMLDREATGYTLVASAAGATSATSASFNIAGRPVVPDFISIANIPDSVAADAAWSLRPMVRLFQANEQPAMRAGIQVTVTARIYKYVHNLSPAQASSPPTPGQPTLVNNTAITDSKGIAQFPDLKYTGPATAIELVFTADVPGSASLIAVSGRVIVVPGAPVGLIIVGDSAGIGVIREPMPVIAVTVDASGNYVFGYYTRITFTPGPGSGSVNPTEVAAEQGYAITAWTMPPFPGPVSLTASALIGGVMRSATLTATAVVTRP